MRARGRASGCVWACALPLVALSIAHCTAGPRSLQGFPLHAMARGPQGIQASSDAILDDLERIEHAIDATAGEALRPTRSGRLLDPIRYAFRRWSWRTPDPVQPDSRAPCPRARRSCAVVGAYGRRVVLRS